MHDLPFWQQWLLDRLRWSLGQHGYTLRVVKNLQPIGGLDDIDTTLALAEEGNTRALRRLVDFASAPPLTDAEQDAIDRAFFNEEP